jgi:hypothetical protein
LDEGIAASSAERVLAGNNWSRSSRCLLTGQKPPSNGQSPNDVHVHAENLGYGGNQKTCYTEALGSVAGHADVGSRFAGLGDPIGGEMPGCRLVEGAVARPYSIPCAGAAGGTYPIVGSLRRIQA